MRPCGHYKSVDCGYPVIPANVCHPGEGSGDLESVPYIVQFDIGLHANVLEMSQILSWEHNMAKGFHPRNCLFCAKFHSI